MDNNFVTNPLEFDESLKELKRKIVCRDEELGYLFRLLGHTPDHEPPTALFIQGDSGVGKSVIIKSILEAGKFRCAFANCGEGYSMKLIFESILNQLTNHVLKIENMFQPYATCNNFLEFVVQLQNVSEKFGIGSLSVKNSLSIIIVKYYSSPFVLDKCEKLRKFDKTILPSFLKLKEFSKLKLGIVLLSTLPWTNYLVEENASEPIIYYLEPYTQKQIVEILKLSKPEEFSLKFFENFLSLFLSIFYQTCHDIRELQYQSKINFENYSEPIRKGELTENDTCELWKRSQPFFKKSLKSLYLKMECEVQNMENLTSVTNQVMSLELPFYSKYLLIASYLASFNPASEDKRLFLKNHGKIKKSSLKSKKVKLYLLGPKPFSLQRLFAILSAILDDNKFNLNADLFIEIASLVKMNLITQISDDILDGPTYKCNVGLQFIDVISKNVQFPIRNYLVDFMDG